MTNDIVKRLQSTGSMSQTKVWKTIDEAADTITALRAEVEKLGRCLALADDAAREWRQHCLAAEAERDRLRAALEQIAEPCSVSVSDRTGPNGIKWRAMYEAWRAICVERVGIARAALTTKGEADDRA